MEIKKEPDEITEAVNQNGDQEDDRKLPAWMLIPDAKTENEEGPESTPPSNDEKVLHRTQLAVPTSASENKRVACKYGEHCYRKNPIHRKEFSHPGDDDYSLDSPEVENGTHQGDDNNRPECEYGTSCYRQNPQHKRDFKHTQPPSTDSLGAKKPRKTAKRRRPSEADYESGGENEYDLNDPFIDDSDEDSIEDEDDEDYVPDVNDQVDPDLLKDDQWKASTDDAPEVLELLKDARDYLRNKKL